MNTSFGSMQSFPSSDKFTLGASQQNNNFFPGKGMVIRVEVSAYSVNLPWLGLS